MAPLGSRLARPRSEIQPQSLHLPQPDFQSQPTLRRSPSFRSRTWGRICRPCTGRCWPPRPRRSFQRIQRLQSWRRRGRIFVARPGELWRRFPWWRRVPRWWRRLSRWRRPWRRSPMNTKPATIVRMAFAIGALLLAAYAPLSVAGKPNQPTFSSAEEASHALFLAARNHDERAVTEILQAGNSPVSADEELQDRLDRERFVQKYEEMHRFVRQANGGMVLYIGAENWPFPIPLVSQHCAWRFDSDAGV